MQMMLQQDNIMNSALVADDVSLIIQKLLNTKLNTSHAKKYNYENKTHNYFNLESPSSSITRNTYKIDNQYTAVTKSKAKFIDFLWYFCIKMNENIEIKIQCTYSSQSYFGYELRVLDLDKIAQVLHIISNKNNQFQTSRLKYMINKQNQIFLSANFIIKQTRFDLIRRQLKSILKIMKQSMRAQLHSFIIFLTSNVKLFFPQCKQQQKKNNQLSLNENLNLSSKSSNFSSNSKYTNQNIKTSKECLLQMAQLRVNLNFQQENQVIEDDSKKSNITQNQRNLILKYCSLINYDLSKSNSLIHQNTDQNTSNNKSISSIIKNILLQPIKMLNDEGQTKLLKQLKKTRTKLLNNNISQKFTQNQLIQKLKLIPKQILNGVTINEQLNLNAAFQTGSFSQISKKFNNFCFNLSINRLNLQNTLEEHQIEKQKQQTYFTSFLVQKQPKILQSMSQDQKQVQKNTFLNQWALLNFLRNSTCSHFAKYYTKLGDQKEQKLENLYIEHYRENLLQLLNKQKNKKIKLTFQRKLSIFKGIVNGIKFLNQRNIIHRDLKLLNIMISKDMQAKIIDFGSACFSYRKDQLFPVKNRHFFSTEGYYIEYKTLPDHLKAKYSKTHYQSHANFDIYSLGIILSKIFVSQLRYFQNDITNIIQHIISNCRQEQPAKRIPLIKIIQLIEKIEKYLQLNRPNRINDRKQEKLQTQKKEVRIELMYPKKNGKSF